MITLNTHTTITRTNQVLKIDTSGSVPDGEYDVLIVLEERQKVPRRQLKFSNHKVIIAPDQHFNREELYENDGR